MDESQDRLYRHILNYPYWLHRIPLRDGRFTPGFKTLDWDRLELPERLDGRSFLEVGAADGMYAFEAERRGASRVMATDIWADPQADSPRWDGVDSRRRSFELCREYLDSDVEGKTVAVEDLSPAEIGQFDVVLCSDVLMHVPGPYTAIERLASVTADRLFVKTPITHATHDRPVAEFTKHRDDRWNWWLPNRECLREMLAVAGCTDIQAFHPPDNPDTGDEVPSIEHGAIVEGVSIHGDCDLTDQIATTTTDGTVMVLARVDGALRVHVERHRVELDGEPADADDGPVQGWVDADAVAIGAGQSLPAKARRTLSEEGLVAFLRESASFVREQVGDERPSHAVVHGRI